MRLLIVEDELDLAVALAKRLSPYFIVDIAKTIERGLYLCDVCQYDLISLDLYLPDGDGIQFCKDIRTQKISTPILVLTGQPDTADTVAALNAGADDYLTKPFKFDELLARLRALLRRSTNIVSNRIEVADLILDPQERTVTRQDRKIQLRRKEFDVLEYLMRNRGKVLAGQQIIEHIWDDSAMPLANVVDAHIKHIRHQIDQPYESKLIKTIYGVGYTIIV